ncbi:hypothetical protein NBRC116188_00900 [Oceaniserpentilla sp. 4NH20-0058]
MPPYNTTNIIVDVVNYFTIEEPAVFAKQSWVSELSLLKQESFIVGIRIILLSYKGDLVKFQASAVNLHL